MVVPACAQEMKVRADHRSSPKHEVAKFKPAVPFRAAKVQSDRIAAL